MKHLETIISKLDIKPSTVALLLNNDPKYVTSKEADMVLEALCKLKHPKIKKGTLIIVGPSLEDALSSIDEQQMNDLGWYRK